MKIALLLILCSLSWVYSFQLFHRPANLLSLRSLRLKATMADSDKVGDTETVKAESLALVPLDKKHIAESAAVTGGILGFVLTGPVGAALFAAVANYVVKRDGDAGEALRGVGKTVIESYNFLYKLNANYGISTRVSESVNKLVESVDSDNEVFEKVKKAITNAASKVTELNDEFDLVGKGKKVLNAAATVSEATIEKTIELDAKYHFVESAKEAADKALDKFRKSLKQR